MGIREVQIIAGANATGKTTFAKGIIKDTGLLLLNADEIALRMAGSGDLRKVRLRAGREFLNEVEAALAGKKSFLLETTLAGRYLIGLMSRFRAEGYGISIAYLFLDSPEEAIHRIRVRVLTGGHDVPEEDIIRRFHRSKRNFWRIYKDLADTWDMFYNCEDTFLQVATGKGDQYDIVNEEGYSVFMEGV